ncbi:hypothetical protein PIIN_04174 [Serendipita indica DSM 11827]|uniref:Structural maintenance of chromosomes protein 5 n=1 Tax=Serendipita indica (strain DSM 11827) TaxID=1109443 RepID=G4TG07_SERID|nr:hypothetical protein PIIN_04174 [Serendipita indica DSM 11827]
MSDSETGSDVPKRVKVKSESRRRPLRAEEATNRERTGRKRRLQDEEESEEEERAPEVQEDDADSGENDSEDDDERRPRKRIKGSNGRPRPSEVGDFGEDDHVPATATTKVLQRDPSDGYIPGSICRIRCEHFLTYDFVEFQPGPRMNMILGPNGTGKSTIACAICLGLGFNVSVLGRADQLQAFVKHGYEKGYVEIELKGKIGKRNPIIRRSITTKGGGSTWTLDGKNATKTQVDNTVASLGIQISNLCSFLPQDRVNEFAKLKPDELLRETQKVAGHPKLSDWHSEIQKLGAGLEEIKHNLTTDQRDCAIEEGKNQVLEREVAAFNRRKELEEKLALYDLLVPWYKYKQNKARMRPIRLAWKEAGIRLATAQAELKPAIDFKNRLEKDLEAANKSIKAAQTEVQKCKEPVERLKRKEERLEKDCKDVQDKLSELNDQEEDSKKRIRQYNEAIETLTAKLKQARGESIQDPAPLTAKKARIVTGLNRLLDKKQQRLNRIERDRAFQDANFYRAYRYLLDHKNDFETVIEPACFSLHVKDARYSSAIEALVPMTAMKTFVFANRRDYETFSNALDNMFEKHRPTVWFRPVNEDALPKNDQDPEEMKRVGFDAYAIDLVEGPPEVLWFLKRQLDLHRIGVALNPNGVDLEGAARLFAPKAPGPPQKYIVGFTLYTINRSAYGQRLIQNSSSNINRAAWLVDQSEEKRRLDEKDAEHNNEERLLRGKLKEAADQVDAITGTLRKVRKIESELESKRRLLITETNRAPVEQRRATLRANLRGKVKARLDLISDIQKAVEDLNSSTEAFTKATYESLQLTADVASMEQMIRAYRTRHEQLQQEVDELSERLEELKKENLESQEAFKRRFEKSTPTLQQKHTEYVDSHPDEETNVEELELERTQAEATLESTAQVNRVVIQQYEDRQKKIERLRDSINQRQHELGVAEARVQRIKDRWLPELNALIEKINTRFSAAFDRIYCAGEVRLAQNDDYSKWAIEILVKFRSNEPLQLLTGQRQSGGERSLTTILYLMSLTGLAKTPFALVDEINQGMDIKYERAVHNELIQVTCAEDSGQYFLITPKLLPNLTYHENVTTLVINNGDYLPDTRDDNGTPTNFGDLQANLEAYRRSLRKT